MKIWSARLFTGSRARRRGLPVLAVVLLAASPSTSHAQALQLQSLQFPTTSVVGPWVTYRVRTQTRSLAPREYKQRVAIVGRDHYEGRDGFWVELKTEGLPSGRRIERGLFVVSDAASQRTRKGMGEDSLPPDSLAPPSPPVVRLVRYQVLTSGGKLYEYPVGGGSEARSGTEISTVELFEYDSSTPPVLERVGPDTLRIGRRVVPTVVERTRRAGTDSWADPADSTHVLRPLLTQTYWRNAAVPITGFARSLFEVTLERASAPARDSTAVSRSQSTSEEPLRVPPSWLGRSRADSSSSAALPIFTRTELELVDLGADAVPEVTQSPEESTPPGAEPPGSTR